MGVNPFAHVIGDKVNFDDNQNGLDKLFPLGSSCECNRQMIPCFIGCSENGSITSKLLANMVNQLEQYATFDQTDMHPFLLLDGHGSHFEEEFLEFVNSPEHKWKLCISIPMGCTCGRLGIQRNKTEALSVEAKNSRQLWYKNS